MSFNYVNLYYSITIVYLNILSAMNTGEIITQLRKKHNWSQAELASKTGVSQVMVGKYERGDATPSIDVAKKIADVFQVSLDYLVGEGIHASFDKKTVNRIQEIQNLDSDTKSHVFATIDAFIKAAKLKNIAAL